MVTRDARTVAPRPLRVGLVVSSPTGYAATFLASLRERPLVAARIVTVFVRVHHPPEWRGRSLRRSIRKATTIGIVGALNGLRMRKWYSEQVSAALPSTDIIAEARSLGIPIVSIQDFVSSESLQAIAAADLDLAVSMGNGYIGKAFFSTPRFGMINIHHEVLPAYRGAQSVLWQLYDGSSVSGYSIHEMTASIDAGRILLSEEHPIAFGRSLRKSVVQTTAAVKIQSTHGLRRVLENFDAFRTSALPNHSTKRFTTPGASAMIRIYRNFFRLRGSRC